VVDDFTSVEERMKAGEKPLIAINLDAVLEAAGADRVVEACNRLASALEGVPQSEELPKGIRGDFFGLAAVLAFSTWEEVVRWATVLKIDLRDLNERELSHLERVSLKLVQRWRSDGTGPTYRNEAGVRYTAKDVWDWRRRGRQSMTSEGRRRGRRPGAGW
jgi:hypothetical protein